VVAASVLVIDPDPDLAPALQRSLRAAPQRSIVVRGVVTLAEGGRLASEAHWDVAVVNLRMPDGEGIAVLDGLKVADPTLAVLVLSDGEDDALAREAVWWGARDFVPRAAGIASLAASVSIAVGSSRTSRRAAGMEASIGALLEGYPDGVVILHGDTGEVLSCNARMDEVLGGASVQELLEAAPELAAGPTPEEPLPFTTPKGTQRLLRVWRSHVEWLSRPAVALTVRDVTDERRGAQRILRLNAMLQGSRHISRLLAKNLPVRETLEGAAEALLDSGSFSGVLFVLHRQGVRPAQVVAKGFDEAVHRVEWMIRAGKPLPCQASALAARGAALARRPVEECAGCPLARSRPGLVLLAPLRFQGVVFGYAAGSLAEHVPLAAEERELFAEIMGDLALAIHGRLAVEAEERVAQEKRKAEERLRMLFDASPSGVVFLAPVDGGEDYRVTQVNGAAERLLGQPAKLLVGRRVSRLIGDPAALASVQGAIRRAAPGEEPSILPANPEAAVPLMRGVEVRFVALSTGEVVAIVDDVRQLAASERMALHSLSLAQAVLDGAHALLDDGPLDQALRELLGKTRDVLKCETAVLAFYREPDDEGEADRLPPGVGTFCHGDPDKGRALANVMRAGRVPAGIPTIRDGALGGMGPILAVGLSPVAGAESAGVLAFAGKTGEFDNHAQRHVVVAAELASLALKAALDREDLRRSREQLQGVFDNAPLGIALVGRDGRVDKANERLTQWFPGAVVGAPVPGWDEPERFGGRPCPARLTAVDGQPHDGEMVVSEGSSSRMYHVAAAALLDEGGRLEGVVVIFDDVTTRERMREAAAKGEGLSKLGALADSIAHEIKNPLTYILSNSQRLAEELPLVVEGVLDLRSVFGLDNSVDLPQSARRLLGRRGLRELTRMATDAARGGEFVAAVVDGLLEFAKAGSVRAKPFQVADAIRKAVEMARGDVRGAARLEWEAPAELWAMGATAQLAQVLIGLIRNAGQAIGDGHPEEHLIRIRALQVEDKVWIVVSDTGPGMSPSVAEHIFDPFYTTKKMEGLGVGLYIAKNLVEAMGGSLEVDTAEGHGTRFTIQLNVSSEAEYRVVKKSGGRLPESSPGGSDGRPLPPASERPRVLLVDDDATVARAVARQLEIAFQVTVATSGEEGLRHITTTPEAFDAILCDFLLGDIDGVDFWHAVDAVDPRLTRRIAFLTGATSRDGKAATFAKQVDAQFISKPPDLEELLTAVEYLVRVSRERL